MKLPNFLSSRLVRRLRMPFCSFFGIAAARVARPYWPDRSSAVLQGSRDLPPNASASQPEVSSLGVLTADTAGPSAPTTESSSLPPPVALLAPAPPHDQKGYGAALHTTDRAPYAQFAQWVTRYESAGPLNREALAREAALQLAEQRRSALEKLIPQDPVSALLLAVPMAERATLPKPIADTLEARVDGRRPPQRAGRGAYSRAESGVLRPSSAAPSWMVTEYLASGAGGCSFAHHPASHDSGHRRGPATGGGQRGAGRTGL